MTLYSTRQLTSIEKKALAQLMAPDFPGKKEVAAQVAECRVHVQEENGSIEFHVNPHLPLADVQARVVTEGEYKDDDEVTVHVLLHVVEGRINQMEIYKEDNSRIGKTPGDACMNVNVNDFT